MHLKLALPILIALSLLILVIAPLTLAAGPEIVRLDSAQSDINAAYRSLFEHISGGGRAHCGGESLRG